ncbi:MAG: UDP-3-O-(3-hydroxymyristoyl)glucosamine N-acyltransferase [Bacteroidota bacterium]
MQFANPFTSIQIAQRLGGKLLGPEDIRLDGINEIHHVRSGDVTFVDHPKYYDKALSSAASLILIDKEQEVPEGKALVVLDNPFSAYDSLVSAERPINYQHTNIDPSAIIGQGTHVAPGAVIGPHVVIGEDCHIQSNAVIGAHCILGDRVIVGPGCIVGSEAFYYKKTTEGYQAWRSGGHVELQDDVELGPNCTIARGVSSTTLIGKGCKFDAQVQIGHDCKIGEHCLFAAQVGVAGNTTIGEWCLLLGQVGVAQNLVIGANAMIYAKSGVSKSLEGGHHYFGYPAQRASSAYRDLAALRSLRKK